MPTARAVGILSLLMVGSFLLAPSAAAAPPTGSMTAVLQPPYTFFYADFEDPEGRDLIYSWEYFGSTSEYASRVSCGSWQPGSETQGASNSPQATWYHGAGSGTLQYNSGVECSHDGGTNADNHVGSFTIHVADAEGNSVFCTKDGPESGPAECRQGTTVHDRSIQLRFSDGTGARNNGLVVFGRLRVSDDFAECREQVPVRVQTRVDGKWVTKKTPKTNDAGRFSTSLSGVHDAFRALAPRSEFLGEDEGFPADVCTKAVDTIRR